MTHAIPDFDPVSDFASREVVRTQADLRRAGQMLSAAPHAAAAPHRPVLSQLSAHALRFLPYARRNLTMLPNHAILRPASADAAETIVRGLETDAAFAEQLAAALGPLTLRQLTERLIGFLPPQASLEALDRLPVTAPIAKIVMTLAERLGLTLQVDFDAARVTAWRGEEGRVLAGPELDDASHIVRFRARKGGA